MIIVYSRAADGLFSRKNKVVLFILNTPAGAREMMLRSIPTHNIFFGAAKIASTMSDKEDREGPTEEILQKYAAYMRAARGRIPEIIRLWSEKGYQSSMRF